MLRARTVHCSRTSRNHRLDRLIGTFRSLPPQTVIRDVHRNLRNWKVNNGRCSGSSRRTRRQSGAATYGPIPCVLPVCDNVMWQRHVSWCQWNSLWKCAASVSEPTAAGAAGAPSQCWIAPIWNAFFTTTITTRTCIIYITCKMHRTQVSFHVPTDAYNFEWMS